MAYANRVECTGFAALQQLTRGKARRSPLV